MSSIWVSDVENEIYTIVKTRASKKLKSKYADIRFTTESESQSSTHFPTVYIHYEPSDTRARSLSGGTVAAFICAATLEVTCSKDQGQKSASSVIYEVIDQFLKLGFNVQQTPDFIPTGNGTVRIKARVERLLGSGDLI